MSSRLPTFYLSSNSRVLTSQLPIPSHSSQGLASYRYSPDLPSRSWRDEPLGFITEDPSPHPDTSLNLNLKSRFPPTILTLIKFHYKPKIFLTGRVSSSYPSPLGFTLSRVGTGVVQVLPRFRYSHSLFSSPKWQSSGLKITTTMSFVDYYWNASLNQKSKGRTFYHQRFQYLETKRQ